MTNKKILQEISLDEFYSLKSIGILFDIFPDAPEEYEEIKREIDSESMLKNAFNQLNINLDLDSSPTSYEEMLYLDYLLFKGKYVLFADEIDDNYTPHQFSYKDLITLLVRTLAKERNINSYELLGSLEKLMIEKNKQYGDAVLNPRMFFIDKSEIIIVVKGLINNKLNRIINQSDDEDAKMDLLGYFVFLMILTDIEKMKELSKDARKVKSEIFSDDVYS